MPNASHLSSHLSIQLEELLITTLTDRNTQFYVYFLKQFTRNVPSSKVPIRINSWFVYVIWTCESTRRFYKSRIASKNDRHHPEGRRGNWTTNQRINSICLILCFFSTKISTRLFHTQHSFVRLKKCLEEKWKLEILRFQCCVTDR